LGGVAGASAQAILPNWQCPTKKFIWFFPYHWIQLATEAVFDPDERVEKTE
jgi:hypothetical protein